MATPENRPALFMVGSFPPRPDLVPDQLQQSNDFILRQTLEDVFEVAAPYFEHSMSDTESTPDRVDWEIRYALDVLPAQPGVKMYPGPHKARTLLSSPHFHLEKGVDVLPVDDNDLGQRVYRNAKEGIGPLTDVARAYGRPELLDKVDVPEVGMSMVYFGANTLAHGAGRMVTHGLRQAIRHRDSRELGRTFWDTVQAFETRFRAPMEQATRGQIDKVLDDPELTGRVEFQISAPATHGLTNLLYLAHAISPRLVSREFRDMATSYLAGTVASVLNYIPPAVSSVVHQCRGEIHPAKYMGSVYHPSEKRAWSNRASVDYAKALLAQTDPAHRPRLIHTVATPATAAVFAGGNESQAAALLTPFAEWPADVRLAAGMLTPDATVSRSEQAYDLLRTVRGGLEADVAMQCGVGRQREAVAGASWGYVAMRGLRVSRGVVEALREG